MLQDARRSGVSVAEDRLVLSAVATTKLPTLSAADHPLFSSLLRDTWPGLSVSSCTDDDAELRAAIERAMEARGLAADAEQARSGPQRCRYSPAQLSLNATHAAARKSHVTPAQKACVVRLQVEKALQLYVACEQRAGVILMGPAGCGKSVLWRTLADACAARGAPVVVHTLNPKAAPRQRLLGSMDLLTRSVPLSLVRPDRCAPCSAGHNAI